jgi:hypothetical protein
MGGQVAEANGQFNGQWSVTQDAERNGCPSGFRFTVRIDNGHVAYVGGRILEAQGGVSPRGRVNVVFDYGSFRLEGTGGLNEHSGAGRWSVPVANCSGRWHAEKK